MAPLSPPPPQKCVYNVPLALDQPLQPLRAKNRNIEFVDGAREHIVGPMPVRDFLDEFLHLDDEPSRSGLLSSWLAFRSVPTQADTPSGIYEPLVSAFCSFLALRACSVLSLDPCNEQEDKVQGPLPWLCLL